MTSFEEARARLVEDLGQQKRQSAMAILVAKLRNRAGVTINIPDSP